MKDIEEIMSASIEQLIKWKHELIRSLPDDDHARNFFCWQELQEIEDEIERRNQRLSQAC